MTAILDDLAALGPKLAERSDEIETNRTLPRDVVDMLRDAGAFRIAASKAIGGPELPPMEQCEVVERLAYHDASVGWCVMIGSDWPYYGSFLETSAANALGDSIDTIAAGQLPPNGKARAVDGGYLVSGRWAFGSGCRHADVIVGGCLVYDGDELRFVDGAPEFVVACAPASAWTIIDNWHTTGLAGSGSSDYSVTELFVPEEHVFRLNAPRRSEPLYRWAPMFVANMPGVALGIARCSIDVAIEIAESKLLLPELVMLRDTSRARSVIAHAEADFGAARAYVYDSLTRLWVQLLAGDDPSLEVRTAVALARANSYDMALRVTRAMNDLIGASSIYRSHPLERLSRDAATVHQHVAVQERMYESIGQLRLTGSATFPLI